MAARVEKLEAALPEIRDRLTKIEARLDSTTTREDLLAAREFFHRELTTQATSLHRELATQITTLHREITGQTWRLITFVASIGTALVAATYFIARNIH